MIQQAINQGLSLAALVTTQTQGYKTKSRIQQIKGEGARINRVIQATASDTSPEGMKARTAAIEKGKELSAERFALDPSQRTFAQYKQNIAYAEAADTRLTPEQEEEQLAYEAAQEEYEQEQEYLASQAGQMAQRAQEHMATKQKTKQRQFKNKSLRQKKKHGVI